MLLTASLSLLVSLHLPCLDLKFSNGYLAHSRFTVKAFEPSDSDIHCCEKLLEPRFQRCTPKVHNVSYCEVLGRLLVASLNFHARIGELGNW